MSSTPLFPSRSVNNKTKSQWVSSGNNIYFNGLDGLIGKVGINTTNPSKALDIAGDTDITGEMKALRYNAISDYRTKENVKELDISSYNVDNLYPVIYDDKTSKMKNIGLIAHELQEHYPFLVDGEKDGEKTQSVNYIGLIGVLIKEIQELKKEKYI
jgi:hypothetical protein